MPFAIWYHENCGFLQFLANPPFQDVGDNYAALCSGASARDWIRGASNTVFIRVDRSIDPQEKKGRLARCKGAKMGRSGGANQMVGTETCTKQAYTMVFI